MSLQKIRKSAGEPDEFEASVAQELLNLEMTSTELKGSLRDLYITAAKEVDCGSGRKAIILYVPFKLLKPFHKIQQRLVRELEKKILWPSRTYHWPAHNPREELCPQSENEGTPSSLSYFDGGARRNFGGFGFPYGDRRKENQV